MEDTTKFEETMKLYNQCDCYYNLLKTDKTELKQLEPNSAIERINLNWIKVTTAIKMDNEQSNLAYKMLNTAKQVLTEVYGHNSEENINPTIVGQLHYCEVAKLIINYTTACVDILEEQQNSQNNNCNEEVEIIDEKPASDIPLKIVKIKEEPISDNETTEGITTTNTTTIITNIKEEPISDNEDNPEKTQTNTKPRSKNQQKEDKTNQHTSSSTNNKTDEYITKDCNPMRITDHIVKKKILKFKIQYEELSEISTWEKIERIKNHPSIISRYLNYLRRERPKRLMPLLKRQQEGPFLTKILFKKP